MICAACGIEAILVAIACSTAKCIEEKKKNIYMPTESHVG